MVIDGSMYCSTLQKMVLGIVSGTDMMFFEKSLSLGRQTA